MTHSYLPEERHSKLGKQNYFCIRPLRSYLRLEASMVSLRMRSVLLAQHLLVQISISWNSGIGLHSHWSLINLQSILSLSQSYQSETQSLPLGLYHQIFASYWYWDLRHSWFHSSCRYRRWSCEVHRWKDSHLNLNLFWWWWHLRPLACAAVSWYFEQSKNWRRFDHSLPLDLRQWCYWLRAQSSFVLSPNLISACLHHLNFCTQACSPRTIWKIPKRKFGP